MLRRLSDAIRWRRTVASLTFDPWRSGDTIQEPGPSDFVIAGCPRTGTSLLAAALFRPPQVVTVMEPWDGLRMAPDELFNGLRDEIQSTGELRRGRLDVAALQNGDVRWQRDGERAFPVDVEDGFQLGVKWPTFWQYLDLMPNTRFLLTVRHPNEVLRSMANTGGRLTQGLEYEAGLNRPLNARLAAVDEIDVRRALLYEAANKAVVAHADRDNVLVVRYERWHDDPNGLREDISKFLGTAIDEFQISIKDRRPVPVDGRTNELISQYAASATALGYSV